MNILLIEDNKIDQMAFLRMIEKQDLKCTVEISEDLSKAKELLNQQTFQLVICDLNLPDGTAFDLAPFFRKTDFYIVSGFVDSELKEKAENVGISQVFEKSNELNQFSQIMEIIQKKLKSKPFQSTNQISKDTNYGDKIIKKLSILFDNNAGCISDVIRTFLDENPKLLNKLSIAVEIEDRDQIVKTAHQLKSGFMMMGLKNLEKMAYDLETEFYITDELHQRVNELIQNSKKSYISLNNALINLNQSA